MTGAGTMLQRLAEREGDRPFVQFMPEGHTVTASELLEEALRVAGGLHSRGVAPGDRVALVMGNSVEYLQAWFACHLAGIVVVPLNIALRGESLAHPLRLIEPRLVLCDQNEEIVSSAMARAGTAAELVVVDDAGSGRSRFDELRGEPASGLRPADPGEPCCVLFTSGTTGPSKGVTWCPGMTEHVAAIVAESMAYGPDDVLYTCLPLFHGNALATSFLPALWAGSRIAVSPRFSASRFWDEIADSGATATNILGVMSPILLNQAHPRERDHQLDRALVIPAPQAYHEQMRDKFGVQVVEAFGQVDLGMVLWNSLAKPVPGSSVARPAAMSCGSSMTTTSRYLAARQASSSSAGANQARPRSAIGGCPRPRCERGATCGSTPATCCAATPTTITSSWTGRRTRFDAGGRTSPLRGGDRRPGAPGRRGGGGIRRPVGAFRGRGGGCGRRPSRGDPRPG